MRYQTDERMNDGGSSYDTLCVIPSPAIDQLPLPYIPGLTVTKRANCSKKCATPEHFHKNVSFLVLTLFKQ